MKKIVALTLALIMVFSLCACGKKAEEKTQSAAEPSATAAASTTATAAPAEEKKEGFLAGLANPMHETTQEGVLEKTGISFQIPADAENVKFFTIDGKPEIAQMTFTFDNVEYNYRIAPTSEYKDISGMNFTWQNSEKAKVDYNEADVHWNDWKEGVILWYDVVPGLMYSLSQQTNSTFDSLTIMAGTLFTPAQGDVSGDAEGDKDYTGFIEAFNGYLAELHDTLPLATAGSTLSAAKFAGRFMDLFTEDEPTAKMLPDLVKAYADTLKGDELEEFKMQLEALKSGADALNNGSSGETLLESCGYEALHAPWNEKKMSALFEAMLLK